MMNIYLRISELLLNQAGLALATVVTTRGSAPQIPGSSAVINREDLIYGTVGGGKTEGIICRIAAEMINTGSSGYYEFNLSNEIENKEEAICGGHISILVDAAPVKHMAVFRQLEESLDANDGGILLTLVKGPAENISVDRMWVSRKSPSLNSSLRDIADPVIAEIMQGGDVSGCRKIDLPENEFGPAAFLFLEPVLPAPKLIIAGAGHIGKALSRIAGMIGFDVTVIDDRPEYANSINIPDANRIIVSDIGKELRLIRKGFDTFVVIVTRGHKDDAEALRACIGADLAYIGMIGSRKKTEAMKHDFIKNGWATEEQWAFLHTPIGVEICSRTIEEIAVSISAELILVKNSKTGKRISCPA